MRFFFHFNRTALLSGTLKTYQRAACDEETMTLKCPPGTTILVEHAQYGRTGMYGISKCNSSVPPMIAGDRPTNHTCIWPQSVQVCADEILSFRTGKCRSSEQRVRFSSLLKITAARLSDLIDLEKRKGSKSFSGQSKFFEDITSHLAAARQLTSLFRQEKISSRFLKIIEVFSGCNRLHWH